MFIRRKNAVNILYFCRIIIFDMALRDIKDLIAKGILRQEGEGGRSVNYTLVKNNKNTST